MMNKVFFALMLSLNSVFAQKLIIFPDSTHQTMHSFGASDCWSMQMVGKYYPVEKREKIAELLFSKAFDKNGNPKGIGLSMWRFNIGAGSAEQGLDSKISSEWRRAECFLENGRYNWNKQQGQQWFLEAARKYKVDYTLGFLNASPVSMSNNGLAIGSGKLGDWNFDKSKIDSLTTFLAVVSKKLKFDYLSPFNEPQWDWGPNRATGLGTQEGTPINNEDLAWATRKIDEKFKKNNVKTRLTLAEAAQIDFLYRSRTNRSIQKQDNQIEDFFSESSPNFIGNLNSVDRIICGHSYFTTSPYNRLVTMRRELGDKIKQKNLGYWQSEFCVLGTNLNEINGEGMDLGMTTALYVAKVIHADLTFANASAWHWWLSVSANNYKDGLIYISNNGVMGENDTNKFDGDILESKLLWTLGNFSRFVRPNMQRIEAHFDNEDVLVSAFKDSSQIVVVLINPKDELLVEIPFLGDDQRVESYTTSKDKNLEKKRVDEQQVLLPSESITTIVIPYSRN